MHISTTNERIKKEQSVEKSYFKFLIHELAYMRGFVYYIIQKLSIIYQ